MLGEKRFAVGDPARFPIARLELRNQLVFVVSYQVFPAHA